MAPTKRGEDLEKSKKVSLSLLDECTKELRASDTAKEKDESFLHAVRAIAYAIASLATTINMEKNT